MAAPAFRRLDFRLGRRDDFQRLDREAVMSATTTWTEDRVDRFIGNLLRGGVILAAGVILFGGVLYLIRHGGGGGGRPGVQGGPPACTHPLLILQCAAALESRGIIQLGLLLLIATPVARVLFSIYAFARQRDFLYVALTTAVLAILLGSLFWGALA